MPEGIEYANAQIQLTIDGSYPSGLSSRTTIEGQHERHSSLSGFSTWTPHWSLLRHNALSERRDIVRSVRRFFTIKFLGRYGHVFLSRLCEILCESETLPTTLKLTISILDVMPGGESELAYHFVGYGPAESVASEGFPAAFCAEVNIGCKTIGYCQT